MFKNINIFSKPHPSLTRFQVFTTFAFNFRPQNEKRNVSSSLSCHSHAHQTETYRYLFLVSPFPVLWCMQRDSSVFLFLKNKKKSLLTILRLFKQNKQKSFLRICMSMCYCSVYSHKHTFLSPKGIFFSLRSVIFFFLFNFFFFFILFWISS